MAESKRTADHSPTPWMLATSNSWRRIVDANGAETVVPTRYSERDNHPDLHFPNGGQDGPDAKFLLKAVNAHDDLVAALRMARRMMQNERYSKPRIGMEDACAAADAALALATA